MTPSVTLPGTPQVIKLGGSLLTDEVRLHHWLCAILMHGAGSVVVVPGGGQYADAVRERQRPQGLTAAQAHEQAIEAMQAMADDWLRRFKGICRRADSLAEVEDLLNAGKVPLAVPKDDWIQAQDITASWDWTSDSLALWLARHLYASGLLLVKAVTPQQSWITAQTAHETGIIDAAFPGFLARITMNVAWAGAGQSAGLGNWMNNQMPGDYCVISAD